MTHPTGPGHPGPDPGPITPSGPRVEPYDLTRWALPVKGCCGEVLAGEDCGCPPATDIPVFHLTGPWADLTSGASR